MQLENHGVCPLVRIHGYFQAMQNLTEHGYQNTSVIVLLAKNLAETSCEYVSNVTSALFIASILCDYMDFYLQMKNDSCNGDEYCSMNCNISSISQLCMQADIGAKIRKYRNATIGNVNTGSVLPEEYATWLNQIPADEYTDVILAKVNNTLNRLGYSCSYYQRFSCTDV